MAAPSALPVPDPSFEARKGKILEQLAVPDAEYSDASPKGTVDAGIRPLLAKINAAAGFVTTSSCAGRVSVFVEGRKAAQQQQQQQQQPEVAATTTARTKTMTAGDADDDGTDGGTASIQPASTQTVAGLGGKGGGGTWLYVSHDPHPLAGQGAVVDWVKELGLLSDEQDAASLLDATGGSGAGRDSERRLIHFKFEPMILHVLTASPAHAQLLLRCALHAGFRESGAVSLVAAPSGERPAQPVVAVRSMGLGFESLIGHVQDEDEDEDDHRKKEGGGGGGGGRQQQRLRLIVPPGYLDTLMTIGHERFAENTKRIRRFEEAFCEATTAAEPRRVGPDGRAWEDAAARRERMRAEGLRRKAAVQAERRTEAEEEKKGPGIDLTPGTLIEYNEQE